MKRGCLNNALFGLLVFLVFGFSSYLCFTFFVHGRSLPTPNLIGKSVADAKAMCSDLGLTLDVSKETRNSDKVPAGYVVWQNRSPGTTNFIKRGTRIKVDLSAGPLVLRVPDFNGQRPGTAVLRLGQVNLKLGQTTYAEMNTSEQQIVAEDPAKDTVVAAQTPVSLLIGVPPAPRPYVMPDLIDHNLEEVRSYFSGNGLNISTVKFESYPGLPDGVIIRQYPLRGAPVSARDAITVVVTRQEEGGIIEQTKPTTP
ncbi:MAG TPA: PASTA domain-containing protein [Thermoanaerobaculia bacterium]|nr:PASTA domain-containing protein [Thermoanaerobaculia bacterium]